MTVLGWDVSGVGLSDLNVDLAQQSWAFVGVLIVLSFLDLSWLSLGFPGYDAALSDAGIIIIGVLKNFQGHLWPGVFGCGAGGRLIVEWA